MNILKQFLLWQAFIVVVTLISPAFLPLRETYLGGGTQAYLEKPWLLSRANFDGLHYLSIARNGYGYAQQAFFPLYPRLISLFKDMVPAAVLISSISFLIGLYVFHRLLALDHPSSVTRWIIICLLVFPTSFFFTAVYTEGLFFLLVVSAFYSARKGNWLAAGIFGALAASTRFIGIFLFPALLLEFWQENSGQLKRHLRRLIPLLLIPLSLLLYSNFLHRTTGDRLAFIHVQPLFGQGRSTKIVMLYQVFWRYVKMVATVNRSDPLYLTILLELTTGVIFLISSLVSLFRHRPSYSLFGLLAYLTPTLSGTFTSLPRYVLICFPSFIIMGEAVSKMHPKSRLYLGLFSLLLSAVVVSLFSRGYWVS